MKRTLIYLILILFFGAIFRLWSLDKIPEGFHADEAAFGYNAYSLLKTGKDEYGKPLPLILRSFDDYKGAIYSYITVPFVAFFGLNEFSVRLPTAIAGILIVALSAGLTYALTQNTALSLITAAVVSFAPSSIVLSRVQSDPLVAVLFMLLGWYCIHRYVQTSRPGWALGSFGFWFISCFTYASPRVFLLGYIPLLFWYYYPKLQRTKRIVLFLLFVGIIATAAYLMLGFSGARFDQINVFTSQDVILPLEEQIREDGVVKSTIVSTRAYHNKFIDYGRYIVHSYVTYLGFDFLFFQSNQPIREKISNTGFMNFFDFPFLLIGIYQIIKARKRWGYLILAWFLFTPLALSVFNQETPNIHRYYFSILPGSIIVALGIMQAALGARKNVRIFVIFGITIVYGASFMYFAHELFVHQPLHTPYYRGFAYKEMVASLQSIQSRYDKIVITKAQQSPYIYLLFFMKYDPKRYQQFGSPRDMDYSGFDKYLFIPVDCPSVWYWGTMAKKYPDNKVLYVNSSGCEVTKNTKVIKRIFWRNGAEAFQFIENVATRSSTINTP